MEMGCDGAAQTAENTTSSTTAERKEVGPSGAAGDAPGKATTELESQGSKSTKGEDGSPTEDIFQQACELMDEPGRHEEVTALCHLYYVCPAVSLCLCLTTSGAPLAGTRAV